MKLGPNPGGFGNIGMPGGLFSAQNPFSNLSTQYQSIQDLNSKPQPKVTAFDPRKLKPEGNSSIFSSESNRENVRSPNNQISLGQASFNNLKGGVTPEANNHNAVLSMLNSSFLNIPLMQDQDVIDIKCPLPVDEAMFMTGNPQNQKKMQ